MKKYLFITALLFGISLAGFWVFAQTGDPFSEITYPIAELGNCKDKTSCEAYCEKPENMVSCLDFADAHNLISKEDVKIGKKMLAAGETSGPGGCRGVEQCGTYCNDMTHLKECVAFAEKHDLMSADELAEAKKVAAALDRGVQPPPCGSKSECDSVCTKPENIKTCITFAKEAGLMPPEELAEAEKVLAALEKGITPPPCGNKDSCDAYCSEPEHLEECITFAEAAGFMSSEEAAMIRRTGGQGPGGCRGKEACEAYCDDPANMEPCINFAIENGFMSPEEAEQAKKMLAAGFTSGPGGCRGQEECEGYCDDVSHMTECVDFAEKMGMMSPEEAEQARQGMQMQARMAECLAMPCSEALSCFESLSPGQPPAEGGEPPEQGGGENDEIQAKIESCIQEMMPPGGMGPSPEEIERMIQEQPPQSFFETAKNFLAGLIPSL